MSVGTYISDAIRNITGYIGFFPEAGGMPNDAIASDDVSHGILNITGIGNVTMSGAALNAGLQVPTALENRPASISVYCCIKY